MEREMTQEEKIDHVFKYHQPKEGQPAKYEAIREAAKQFALVVARNTPRCPDQTVSIRKIREAVMTANAAIACEGVSV